MTTFLTTFAGFGPHQPADRDDVRFEILDILGETDDPQMATLCLTIDDHGYEIDRNYFASWDSPYDLVEAYREAQTSTLEERLDRYAEIEADEYARGVA